MPGHTLKVTLDRDVVNLRVECHEPDGAFCRKMCNECEEYCVDPKNHIKPIDYCLAFECFDAKGATEECYAGARNTLPLRDGMDIIVHWNGYIEQWEWRALTDTWQPDHGPVVSESDAAHRAATV